MKIGIDCGMTGSEGGGAGDYVRRLVRGLAEIDSANSYALYLPAFARARRETESLFPRKENFTVCPGAPARLLKALWRGPAPSAVRDYAVGDVDVFHSTGCFAPRLGPSKRLVVTIHDLTAMARPEWHTRTNVIHCTKGIIDAVKYADAIIALSWHAKKELMKYADAPEGLVTVTPLAAGGEYCEVMDEARLKEVRARYGLPERYVLSIGSPEPGRNLKRLLEAYSTLHEEARREFPLVVAGEKGFKTGDALAIAHGLGIAGDLRFIGHVPGSDMAAVYSRATVFAFPSLYEGFGLPVLEAMSCGAPVIASDTTSMPEVAGKAALLVDPQDVEGIAFALDAVLRNKDLRGEMRDMGLRRAGEFSWERCAKETLGVYERVFGQPKR